MRDSGLVVSAAPWLAPPPALSVATGLEQGQGGAPAYPWDTSIVTAGPKLWLRGDVVTLNGGTVSAWPDQSGNGNHVLQSAGVSQPAWVATDATYNGKPTLNFVGSKWMQLAAFFAPAIAQPCTWYVVGHGSADRSNYRVFVDGISASRQLIAADVTTGLLNLQAGGQILSDVQGGTPHILAGVVNGGASEFHVNSYRTANAIGNAGANALDGVTLGAAEGPGAFLEGTIAEVVLFPGAHTQAQRTAIMRYLSGRYGQILLARTRDLRGLYRASVGVTLGTGVQSWADQSGLAHHLLQAVGANQPAYGTLGAFACVTGDGVNDFLDSAFTLSGADTVFHVSRWNLPAGAQSTLFDGGGGGVGNQNRFYRTPGGDPGMFSNGAGFIGAGVNTTAVHVHSNIFSAASSSYRQNGVQVAAGTTALSSFTNGFRLFAFGSGGDCAAASVAEALIFAGALPLADVQAIEADLMSYYSTIL